MSLSCFNRRSSHVSYSIYKILKKPNGKCFALSMKDNYSTKLLLAKFQKQQWFPLTQLCVTQVSHHFYHFDCSINAQVVEEGEEVFLHLNTIVIHLRYSENAHLALPPYLQPKEEHTYRMINKSQILYKYDSRSLFLDIVIIIHLIL